MQRHAIEELRSQLEVAPGSIPFIPVINAKSLDQQVTSGRKVQTTIDPSNGWEVSRLLCMSEGQSTTLIFKHVDPSAFRDTPQIASAPLTKPSKGKKRDLQHGAVEGELEGDQLERPKKKRKARTCVRCHSATCLGKWMGKSCSNLPNQEPEAAHK
jgi:hypothetical protein